MTRIVIITRAFPWLPGEHFVEPEAPYWEREDAEVVVMPWHMDGEPRPLPPGVHVDDCIAAISPRERHLARLSALRTSLFWQEIGMLARQRRLNRSTAQETLRAVGGALAHRDALTAWIARHGEIDVVYTYWWDVWTYGAQLLKGHGVHHVVSRAHGYDLYQHRSPCGHLALKQRLGPELDRLLVISTDGARAAVEEHGMPPELVRLARLGVELPPRQARVSGNGELHLLSTAMANPVKRIDRLVDAVGLLAAEHPELQVHWTHFGDGPELEGLRARSARAAEGVPNLHVNWAGAVPNEVLREHLASRPVDVFVNTSESEGVPVSIMEAMAFGVPAIAPAVGGIGEIVPAAGPGGQLLSPTSEPAEVALSLWQWRERAKQPDERSAARAVVARSYDQAVNFTSLMDELVALARG